MSTLNKAQVAQIAAKLAALPEPDLTDPDNPEWTAADFARARGPQSLTKAEMAAFPKSKGGRPRAERPKLQVTMRLDQDVVEHFKGDGDGWQTRINAALRSALPQSSPRK